MTPTTALGVIIALQPLALLKKHIQVVSAFPLSPHYHLFLPTPQPPPLSSAPLVTLKNTSRRLSTCMVLFAVVSLVTTCWWQLDVFEKHQACTGLPTLVCMNHDLRQVNWPHVNWLQLPSCFQCAAQMACAIQRSDMTLGRRWHIHKSTGTCNTFYALCSCVPRLLWLMLLIT